MKTFKLLVLAFVLFLVILIPIIAYVYKIDSFDTAKTLAQGKEPLKHFYNDLGPEVIPFGDKLGVITKIDNDFLYVKTSTGKIEKVALYFEVVIPSTNPNIKSSRPIGMKAPVPVMVIDGKKSYNAKKFEPLKPGAVVQVHPIGGEGIEITVYNDVVVPKS